MIQVRDVDTLSEAIQQPIEVDSLWRCGSQRGEGVG
jgi:hypothetical protein